MSHDRWDNRHWIIRPYPQAAEVWSVVIEEDVTCRKSLDGANVLLKFDGETPAILASDTVYDHAAILEILRGPDWSEPIPDPDP